MPLRRSPGYFEQFAFFFGFQMTITGNFLTLLKAADDVRTGRYSVRAAADFYGISRSTLHDQVRRKYSKIGAGKNPTVPRNIQESIVGSIQTLAEAAEKLAEIDSGVVSEVVGKGNHKKNIEKNKIKYLQGRVSQVTYTRGTPKVLRVV